MIDSSPVYYNLRTVGYSNGVDNYPMYSFIINMAPKVNFWQEINANWSLVVSNMLYQPSLKMETIDVGNTEIKC